MEQKDYIGINFRRPREERRILRYAFRGELYTYHGMYLKDFTKATSRVKGISAHRIERGALKKSFEVVFDIPTVTIPLELIGYAEQEGLVWPDES